MQAPPQTVALPLKGNEFQANHNSAFVHLIQDDTVALPLKGNEFQANHNQVDDNGDATVLLLYLSKVTNFKQITTLCNVDIKLSILLLYLSKVTNFKQITTMLNFFLSRLTLLLYLSKVTNFKQITTDIPPNHRAGHCCFTSQR